MVSSGFSVGVNDEDGKEYLVLSSIGGVPIGDSIVFRINGTDQLDFEMLGTDNIVETINNFLTCEESHPLAQLYKDDAIVEYALYRNGKNVECIMVSESEENSDTFYIHFAKKPVDLKSAIISRKVLQMIRLTDRGAQTWGRKFIRR